MRNIYTLLQYGKTDEVIHELIYGNMQIERNLIHELMFRAIDKGNCDLVVFLLNEYHSYFNNDEIKAAFRRSVLSNQAIITNFLLEKVPHAIDLQTRKIGLNQALYYDYPEVVRVIIRACADVINEPAKYSTFEKAINSPKSADVILKDWNNLCAIKLMNILSVKLISRESDFIKLKDAVDKDWYEVCVEHNLTAHLLKVLMLSCAVMQNDLEQIIILLRQCNEIVSNQYKGELFIHATMHNHLDMLKAIMSEYGQHIDEQEKLIALEFAFNEEVDSQIADLLLANYASTLTEKSILLLCEYSKAAFNKLLLCPDIELTTLFQHVLNKSDYDLCIDLIVKGVDIHHLNKKTRKKWQSLCANKNAVNNLYQAVNPNYIQEGPLNKNLYSYELEWVAQFALKNPDRCFFAIKENIFIINIEGMEVNLTRLLNAANLNHIELTEDDSTLYFKQFPINCMSHEENLPPNYCLPDKFLTKAEQYIIEDYTAKDGSDVNYLLHGGQPQGDKKYLFTAKNFFKIIFTASALNKIMPTLSNEHEIPTFRGEKYITLPALMQRTRWLDEAPEGIVIQHPAFASTSSSKEIVEKKFSAVSLVNYCHAYGKNVQPLSINQNEDEFLQLPSHLLLTSYKRENEKTIFQARQIQPLLREYPSIQQEKEFFLLLSQFGKNALWENKFASMTHYQDSEELPDLHQLILLMEECKDVLENYLIHPFTNTSCREDWQLSTMLGIINRPNHGLPHSMRVAQLVAVVALFLNYYSDDDKFNFTKKEIMLLQLAAIFSVVGRENDVSFHKDSALYLHFAERTLFIFETHAKNKLHFTDEDIKPYKEVLKRTMHASNEWSREFIVFIYSHKLDLLRCYTKEEFDATLLKYLVNHLPQPAIDALIQYAENLLHATGDRVISGNSPASYNKPIFYANSTNAYVCMESILKVPVPVLELRKKLTELKI